MASTANHDLAYHKNEGSSGSTSKRIVYLTREESFSAAHRLHSPSLSDEENKAIFGKCNSPNGHGHNYKIQITLAGEPHPITGMVINLTDLKAYITRAILDKLDHKNIDKDVPYFAEGVVSTAENLVIWMWDQMVAALPNPKLLHEIKCWETEKNVASYKGTE